MADIIFPGELVGSLAHLRPREDRFTSVASEDRGDVLEEVLNEVLTQYRESPKLLHLIRNYMERLDDLRLVAEELPNFFDVLTASGDQLTIIGKWLGWPRAHRVGVETSVFGYSYSNEGCEDDCSDGPPVAGWCTGEWGDCINTEFSPYFFDDDDVYRRYLLSRVVQLFGDYRRRTVTLCSRLIYGDTAYILREGAGWVTISTGRPFLADERSVRHLVRQVLPVAPGVLVNIVSQPSGSRVFGYGRGWGEWCTGVWK